MRPATARPMPAPPSSVDSGEYLYVNCHYSVPHSVRPLQELSDSAHTDALSIAGRLATTPGIQRYLGAVITVYCHIPVIGAARPARRRAYRLSVRCKDLPTTGAPLTPELFERVCAVESAELEDIAELLHATVP